LEIRVTEKLTIEKRGHLLLIGLNRAAKRNAFDIDMLHGLAAAYTELESDAALRCGVLFAHGDHFTAGLDLAAVAPHFASGDWKGTADQIDPLALEGKPLSKPMVTAVQGLCFTIGIELMLASEIRIAADSSRLAMLEVKRGIYPVGGATMRFVHEAGWGNAMRYLLTGDEFTAADALRMGIVQEVVPHGKQLERALELAERVAKQAPLGVAAVIRSGRISLRQGELEASKQLLPDLKPILASEDANEGVMSFLERREAKFTGK
jgi:enoyl-CoA hydratase/carnithine racemase